MISEQKFNETYEEFKNIVGKERLNKNKNSLINKFKIMKQFILMFDPECEATEEIDKLFNKFKKDDDLYNLVKNIPDNHFINLAYEKMKEVIIERRK